MLFDMCVFISENGGQYCSRHDSRDACPHQYQSSGVDCGWFASDKDFFSVISDMAIACIDVVIIFECENCAGSCERDASGGYADASPQANAEIVFLFLLKIG